MLYKHSKHLSGRYKKSAHHLVWLLCLWAHFLPQVDGFFMSDAKAVLQGCDDHWSLQEKERMPVLFQTTVCVDVQVLSPGEWTAFSYVSVPAPRYELALQGDANNLYAWLLGVRHQVPVQLTTHQWYHICLRWDAPRKSFSLTIGGNSEVYQRTAIARAIPPSGRLLLGCQPNKASPGVKMATVELYLFRIWDDVGEHRACEDGTVIGWDSRLWAITQAQARVQDYTLQCASQGSASTPKIVSTSSPLQLILTSIITGSLKSTTQVSASTTQATTTSNPAGLSTTTSNPSVTLSAPTQIPLTSTTTSNTITPANQAGSAFNNIITMSNASGLNMSPPTPASPMSYITTQTTQSTSTSAQSLSSNHTSHPIGTFETTVNHTTESSSTAPSVATQVTNQTAVLRTMTSNVLFTEPFAVQCNFSQSCVNESSYYWMLVEVKGSNMTEEKIQIWFSDLFNESICSARVSTTGIETTSCHISENTEVRCEAKQNIQRTNCTVLLQLSQPVNTCILRRLVQNGTINPSIQIQLQGDVERVGKGLCPEHDITPPGGGFVHCTSPMSYDDVCKTQGPVNVTCAKGQIFAVILNESCEVLPSESYTTQVVPPRTSSESSATFPNITSPSVTRDWSLTNQTHTPVTPSTPLFTNTSSTQLNTTSLIFNTSINNTDNQTNTVSNYTASLPLNSTRDIVPPVNIASTPHYITTSVVSTTHKTSSVTPQLSNTAVTTHYTTTSPVSTTGTSDNIATSPVNTTGTSNNIPASLVSTTNMTHNITTPPVSATSTTHNITTSPVNTTVTSNNIPASLVSTANMIHNITTPPVGATGTTHNIATAPVNTTGTSNNTPVSLVSTTNMTHNITTLPVTTTGTTPNINTSPISTTGTSNNIPASLVSTTTTTHNITTPPVSTMGTTHNITTSPVNTTGTSNNIPASLVSTTTTTHNITTLPVSTMGTTHTITTSPVNTTVTSNNIPASLVSTTNMIHNITTLPVTTTGTTPNINTSPISTTGTSNNIPESPVSTTTTTHDIITPTDGATSTTYNVTTPPVHSTNTAHDIITTTVPPTVGATGTSYNITTSQVKTTLNITTSGVSATHTTLDVSAQPVNTADTTEKITTSVVSTTHTTLDLTTQPVHTADTTDKIATSVIRTTHTTLDVATQPVNTASTPHNITTSPVSTTATSNNIANSPVRTTGTESTLNITTSPVSTIGTSNNIPTSPISTTNMTHNIIIPPVSATGTPYNITTSPVSTTKTTLNLTTSLIHTTDTAHSITPSLVHTIDPTHNITTPAKITETTFDTTNSSASTRDTTLNVTAALVHTTSTPHNITTSPVKTTEMTINTTTSLDSTTDIALNVTTPPVNTTVQNLTYSVNTTVTPLNLTVTRLSSTNPTVSTTATSIDTTAATVTALDKTTTTLNTLIMPLNTTGMSLITTAMPPSQVETTTPPNTTAQISKTLTTTVRPLNATAAPHFSTAVPLISTALHHTIVTPFNTTVEVPNSTFTSEIVENGTQSSTNSSQISGTESTTTTTFLPNTTLFNLTALLHLNATTPPLNTTQHSTTFTIHLNTTEQDITTVFNTTLFSHNVTTLIENRTDLSIPNVTEVNVTLKITTNHKNTAHLNVSSPVLNTTTQYPHVTQYNTTTLFENATHSNNTSLAHTTESPSNVNESNTTQPLETTSELNTTAISYYTTQLLNVSTVETTDAETDTTTDTLEFNTTMYSFNFTTFNTTDVTYSNTTDSLFNTTQSNTTAFTINITLFNTTDAPLNETNFNGTDVNRSINSTETSNITLEFNTTVSPTVNVTQFDITNTTQMHTTTFPTTENITSGPTNSTLEPVTTVSLLNTTQSNGTIENAFTENIITNTTTTINPINIPNNIPTNTTVISIVTNSSTAPTTAPSVIHPSSPQNSSTSTAEAPIIAPTPTTSKSNTTTFTTLPAVPTTPATTMATTTGATTKSPDAVASDLLNKTQNLASLNSTEVNQLVNQLENLISAPNISLDLGRTVLSVINNFLNSSTDTVAASSNRLIKAVDNLGLKLVIRDQTENIVFDSLALTVTKVDGTNFGKTSFTIADPLNPQVTKGLQRQLRAVESSSPLAKITLPASLTENLSPEEKKIASRVQFTFFQKSIFFQDKTLSPEKLNSHILGSSVANLSIKNLRENVIFTLRNKQPVAGNYVASCVFWDFDKNGGLGGWNGNGCSVKNSSTENETVCSCNHLTSFAVLLDISRQGITDRLQATILTFITYIGCGVSAIFLSVTLITYLAFEKLRHDIPSKILIHLCFGLLLLNLVFLLDSWLALYKDAVGLCISTAFFLHYFLLVSFTWMGLEALHMYLAIVKVFNNFMSRYMLKFSLAGWGIPLVVVIIVIAINKDNYGLVSYGKFSDGTTDEFCWLNNNIAFYVAVVAYFCVIFVLNLAMFVVVMIHLRRIKRRNPHNNQYHSSLHDLRSIAGLTFLLGLTWGFAFFAWGPVNLAFTYLFAIFNSLQGFFIFVFHCALKESVRKQWRMYLCCGSLRLAENSEWSRTATQSNHTKKTSIMTADSGSHSVPRSSVSSDDSVPSQGIGSPVDDSVIMLGEANDDVIFNQMNSQIHS
uniref:Adhesion G-protein coupled receptor G2 n=1 Tax=Cyprinus carpio TaxID=7962 RepID=A0A8C1GBC6_CYPCA